MMSRIAVLTGATGGILVIGGTKLRGIPKIESFLIDGNEVTIATREKTSVPLDIGFYKRWRAA